jgi:hypothetical protein
VDTTNRKEVGALFLAMLRLLPMSERTEGRR